MDDKVKLCEFTNDEAVQRIAEGKPGAWIEVPPGFLETYRSPMSNFEIAPVPANAIHDHWTFVRAALEEMCRDYPAVTWIPEDVYSSLSNGRSDLLLAKNGERPLGFVIGFVQPIAFTDKKEWFVWEAWTLNMKDRDPEDSFAEINLKTLNFVKAYAKGLNCSRLHCLVFVRKGDDRPHRYWERMGFVPESTSYVLEI